MNLIDLALESYLNSSSNSSRDSLSKIKGYKEEDRLLEVLLIIIQYHVINMVLMLDMKIILIVNLTHFKFYPNKMVIFI